MVGARLGVDAGTGVLAGTVPVLITWRVVLGLQAVIDNMIIEIIGANLWCDIELMGPLLIAYHHSSQGIGPRFGAHMMS